MGSGPILVARLVCLHVWETFKESHSKVNRHSVTVCVCEQTLCYGYAVKKVIVYS